MWTLRSTQYYVDAVKGSNRGTAHLHADLSGWRKPYIASYQRRKGVTCPPIRGPVMLYKKAANKETQKKPRAGTAGGGRNGHEIDVMPSYAAVLCATFKRRRAPCR